MASHPQARRAPAAQTGQTDAQLGLAPDVSNLLELCRSSVVTRTRRILMPKRIPGLNTFFNGFLANLWPFNHLCVSYWIVARPRPSRLPELTVSVVCPCRNEVATWPS